MNHSSNHGKAITSLVIIIALLVGFTLGRFTAGNHNADNNTVASSVVSSATRTIAAAPSATTAQSQDNTAASTSSSDASIPASSDSAESGTSEQSASDSTSSLSGATGASYDDLNSTDLVDAASAQYTSSSSDSDNSSSQAQQITHTAQTEVPSEETTVDPSNIEDVTTLNEAPLPDGVASTLYAKTGGTAMFQIVVLGDSQFANFTDQNGLGYLLSRKMHANVYNLAIGGKTATVDPKDSSSTDPNQWGETCGVSMVKAVCGLADASHVFNGFDYQMNVFNSCNFSKTDIFVLEFGVNDYLAKRPMTNQDDLGSYLTVFGAFETMVLDIRNTYPTAQILICVPTYAQFWQSGTGAFLGDSNIVNNGYGTLYNYAETISHPAGGHSNTSTVDEYLLSGINIYSAPEDLLDGIHLTDKGRVKYVNLLSRIGLRVEGYDIGEGVDPDTVDWVSQTPQAQ